VFLAGDRQAWDPGGGSQRRARWDIMRLAFLHYVWAARCRAARAGVRAHPAGVAAQIVHYLRGRMRADATRAFTPRADFSLVCDSWLPDRPPLAGDAFEQRWCEGGVLCARQGSAVQVLLSVRHPVPLPMRQ
jgi:hypothetical protein